MVLTLEEVTPLKNHLQAQIEAKVKVAVKKKSRYGQLALGLAVVLLTQSKNTPITHFQVASGIQDVRNRTVGSMSALQAQMLILSKYGLLRKVSTNYCNEYYITVALLPEGDL